MTETPHPPPALDDVDLDVDLYVGEEVRPDHSLDVDQFTEEDLSE